MKKDDKVNNSRDELSVVSLVASVFAATCHGCGGKGWVETAGGAMVHICPICKGTGLPATIISTMTGTNDEEIKVK